MADTNDIRNRMENAASQAKQAASQAKEGAHEAAATAMSKAHEMADAAGKKVDEATTALGERVKSVAGSLRERGPRDGMLGNATGAVAASLEHTGRYIQEEGLMGMAKDVTELIRRNPLPAVLVGIGLGFMVAHMFRRES